MELRRISVCRDCLSSYRHTRLPSRPSLILGASQGNAVRTFATVPESRRCASRPFGKLSCAHSPAVRNYASEILRTKSSRHAPLDLNAIHTRVQELSASALKAEDAHLPSEQRVLYVFEQLSFLAHLVLGDNDGGLARERPRPKESQQQTATSALLGSVNTRQSSAPMSRDALLAIISGKAEAIVRHPDVFITAAILKAYVELQSLLGQPASFPDVFEMYAHKAIPRADKHGVVEYGPASPDKINAAIDPKTSNIALQCAIESRNLSLALDVITTAFCTPAYKRSKVVRQAGVPLAGLALAPLAAWTLSSQFSVLQQTMDPAMATGIAFAGIMTYVGAVGTMGYVVVTTANDQMDRITWASGVPLWERWIREEERASIDRVAGAWGFKDTQKRGDEEGAEWESLREWVGARGMILDRVNLMEGME